MKKWTVNCATCDMTKITEETLKNFDAVNVNCASVLMTERTKELLSRYPVTLNCASTHLVPEGTEIESVSGTHELSGGGDHHGFALHVSGKLTIHGDALENAASYEKIIVCGTVVMPKSFAGRLNNLSVLGSTECYPDGAVRLGSTAEIDRTFPLRAKSKTYYAARKLLFTDIGLDAEKLKDSGAAFESKRAVIAEGLLPQIAPLLPETCEITVVEDGMVVLPEDAEITEALVKRKGGKFYVDGNYTVKSEAALAGIEKLRVAGELCVPAGLAESIQGMNAEYGKLRVLREYGRSYIGLPKVEITGEAVAEAGEKGLLVKDCAIVMLSEKVATQDICRIRFENVALLVCDAAQKAAVQANARDVAQIQDRENFRWMFREAPDNKVTNGAQIVL